MIRKTVSQEQRGYPAVPALQFLAVGREGYWRSECVRVKTDFLSNFKLIWVVQIARRKYFALSEVICRL